MNKKMKRRLAVVSAAIVVVLVAMMTVVGGNTAAKSVTVAEAADASLRGAKIQVSGNVVNGSYATQGSVLTFSIYDPEGSPEQQLPVRYEGAASSTFGNDVTAICTGKVGEDGVLEASELITKCPSKYEGADASQHPSDVTSASEELEAADAASVGAAPAAAASGSAAPEGK